MASEFASKLKASKKLWKTAQQKVVDNRGKSDKPQFEDGIYLAKLTGAKLVEFDSGLKVVFDWKFEDGEYDGQIKKDYQGITSEDNLYYFGRRIEELGYEMPDSPEDLPELLAALEKEKPLGKIRLRTKGDYQNVYLEKLLTGDEDEDEDDAAEEDAEEADETEEAEEEEKPKKGKKGKPASEPEADDEEEEEEEETDEEEDADAEEDGDVELAVGMKVIADTQKGKRAGTVKEILAKEGLVRVDVGDGKVVRVALDKVAFDDTPDDEEEDETEEPPAKKAVKKKAPPKKKR
jgi:hypothetical protein